MSEIESLINNVTSNSNTSKRKFSDISETSVKHQKNNTTESSNNDNEIIFISFIKTLKNYFKLISKDKNIYPVKEYVLFNHAFSFSISTNFKQFIFSENKRDYKIYYLITSNDRIKERKVDSINHKKFKPLHFINIEGVNKIRDNKLVGVNLNVKFLDNILNPDENLSDPFYSQKCDDNKDFLEYYNEKIEENIINTTKYLYIFVEFMNSDNNNNIYQSAIVEISLYKGLDIINSLYKNNFPEFITIKGVHGYYKSISSQIDDNNNNIVTSPNQYTPVLPPVLNNQAFPSPNLNNNNFNLNNITSTLPLSIQSDYHSYPDSPRYLANSQSFNSSSVNLPNHINPSLHLNNSTNNQSEFSNQSVYHINYSSDGNNSFPNNSYNNQSEFSNSFPNDMKTVYSPKNDFSNISPSIPMNLPSNIYIRKITINNTIIYSSQNNKKAKIKEITLDEQSSKCLYLDINGIDSIDKQRDNYNSNEFLISYYEIIKKSGRTNRDDNNQCNSEDEEYEDSSSCIKKVFEVGSKEYFVHSSPYFIGDNTILLYNSKLGRKNTLYFFVITKGNEILFISELVVIKTYRRSKNKKRR